MQRLLCRKSIRISNSRFIHRYPTFFRRNFCENVNPNSASNAGTTSAAAVGNGTLQRYSFLSRRLTKILLGFGLVFGSGYYVHEKEFVYAYCIEKLKTYKGVKNDDEENQPSAFLTYTLMGWSYLRSWEPIRFSKYMPDLIELLDPAYPTNCRMGAMMVILQVLNFDPSLPPRVVYDKCLFKKKLLKSSQGEKFMQALYNLVGEADAPELMMGACEFLTRFPTASPEPSEAMVESLMKELDAPRELVYPCCVRFQEYEQARLGVMHLQSRGYQTVYQPNFKEISQLCLEHRQLEFALKLWKSPNNMFKQFGFMMIPALISGFETKEELDPYIGQNDREIRENRIAMYEVLTLMGQNHMQRTENRAAIKCFEDAQKLMGMTYYMAHFCGLAHKELNNIDEAEKYFLIALQQSRGQFVESRMELADLNLKSRGQEGAEHAVYHYQMLVKDKQNPQIEDVYKRLLYALVQLKEYEKAFIAMEELLVINPRSVVAMYEAGKNANLSGHYEEAEHYLRQAIQIERANVNYKYQLALSLYQQGINAEESELLIDEVLRYKKDHVKCLQLKSRLAEDKGNLEETLVQLDMILAVKPDYVSILLKKAEIQETLYRMDDAFTTYNQIIAIWSGRLIQSPTYFQNRLTDRKILEKLRQRKKRKYISNAYKDFQKRFIDFENFREENLQQSSA